jgi:putative inorganic carbon (HCO3(-)) transporter
MARDLVNKSVPGESRIYARDTRPGWDLQAPRFLQIALVLLAVLVSSVAGVFGLIYPLPYSPLIIGGAIAAAVTGVAFLRKPVWALYAALFVVLLPTGLIPDSIHSLLNRSMTVVAFATWLFDAVARHRRVRWTITATLMLVFLTWSIFTLLWAQSLSSGMTVLQTYVLRFVMFLFLIPNEIRSKRDLNGLLNTLALNGWILVIAGAATILLQGYTPGTRLQVLGMNENEIGILALVTMIGVLWQVLQPSQRNKPVKILVSWVFLLVAIALAAASGSRGSAISLVVTLMALCLWRPTRPWGLLGMLVLALGAILAPLLFSTTLARFTGTTGDTILGGREALWQAATMLILDHPWTGVGIGNAPYGIMVHLRALKSVLGYETAAIHNPVLTVWAETGFLGILLYLGVLGSAVWSFAQQYRKCRRSGAYALVPYFALVSSVLAGYMASWIKGGGVESDFTYFLMLALLLIPSSLDVEADERDVKTAVDLCP